MPRFKLEVGSATEIGRQRERNEDRFAVWVGAPEALDHLQALLLVADGLGGQQAGDRASQLVADHILDTLTRGTIEGGLRAAIRQAVRESNDELLQLGRDEPEIEGLGSTLVLAAVRDDRLTVAHVGDSRCYLIRDHRIECLTGDHSWVAERVRSGALSSEDAEIDPRSSLLTRSLGDPNSPEVDFWAEELRDGDTFLLCSDGLTKALSDTEIFQLTERYPSPQDSAEALAAVADSKDGSDNVTVVVARCRIAAGRSPGFEPEDTEPILRPEELAAARSSSWRAWRWFSVGFLAGLLAYHLARAFEILP